MRPPACRARSSTRRPPATVLSAGHADAVGDLHADRRGELHDRDRRRSRSTWRKATPTITWATPADIVYGTALSATQLNATTPSVAGTFVYTPAAGDVLSAGHADAVGHLHADRRRRTTRRRRRTVSINVGEGDADHHLADARGHRLRHRAQCDAAERDRRPSPGTFVYTPAPATCSAPATQQRCR